MNFLPKALTIFFTATIILYSPSYAQDAIKLIQKASQEAVSGNAEEAIKLSNQAVEKDPDNLTIRNLRGGIFVQLEQFDKAIEAFEETKPLYLARLESGRKMTMLDKSFFKTLPLYYTIAERYEEALISIEETKQIFIKYEPENKRVLLQQDLQAANILFLKLSFDEALETYLSILEQNKELNTLGGQDLDSINDKLGFLYFNSEEYAKSAPRLEQALQRQIEKFGNNHPAVADAQRKVSRIHFALGDLDIALQYLDDQLTSYLDYYEHLPVSSTTTSMKPAGFDYEKNDWMQLSKNQQQELFTNAVIKVFNGPKKVENKDTLMVAVFYEYLADAEQALGDTFNARLNYQTALEELTQILGSDHPRNLAINVKLENSRATELSIELPLGDTKKQERILNFPSLEGLKLDNTVGSTSTSMQEPPSN